MGYNVRKIHMREVNKMTRQELVQLFKCIVDQTVDKMPEMLEPIPVVGKSIGLLIQCVTNGVGNYNELKANAEDDIKKAVEEMQNPDFMDCIMLTPKKGYPLTEAQQENLINILSYDYESDDEDSLSVIDEFISEYMGGHVEVDSEDDCGVSSGYLYLNFFEYDEHPYNEEDARSFMDALNRLLGAEVFDYYVIDGHMDSQDEG